MKDEIIILYYKGIKSFRIDRKDGAKCSYLIHGYYALCLNCRIRETKYISKNNNMGYLCELNKHYIKLNLFNIVKYRCCT